jgi:hypothetical protein
MAFGIEMVHESFTLCLQLEQSLVQTGQVRSGQSWRIIGIFERSTRCSVQVEAGRVYQQAMLCASLDEAASWHNGLIG